ncbi:MAG: hypothetical protein II151_05080 [Bacteroidales bacterium]|nr:hypothetical protein [Bacteroidales bacterium]
MNGIVKKLLCYLILPLLIVLLGWLIVKSVMKPVEFNKQKAAREQVGIQRLKDIRDLQVAFNSVNGHFASTLDSLKDFYKKGEMSVTMQVGSRDDSLAMAHTDAVKKTYRKVNEQELNQILYKLYQQGDKNLVFSVTSKIPVRDTLFNGRTNFSVDSLDVVPFSGGDKIEMSSIVKTVSGVAVPLFEAKMPYKQLLKGLDNQLRINLDAERMESDRYEGLQVGSITSPNNNAGNWE